MLPMKMTKNYNQFIQSITHRCINGRVDPVSHVAAVNVCVSTLSLKELHFFTRNLAPQLQHM